MMAVYWRMLADQYGSFQLVLKNSKIIYFSGGSRRFSRITADGWRMTGDHAADGWRMTGDHGE